jgi:hypothetical protein
MKIMLNLLKSPPVTSAVNFSYDVRLMTHFYLIHSHVLRPMSMEACMLCLGWGWGEGATASSPILDPPLLSV